MKRKSSIFSRARRSFFRSSGQRGASVETLRGSTGADFEGIAKINRGAAPSTFCFFLLSCCQGNDSPKDRFLLIKGPFCFVFEKETSKSPLYAISLQGMSCKVVSKATGKNPTVTVSLTSSLGDSEYEIELLEKLAEKFSRVVQEQASVAHSEQVRQRLGHGHLVSKRSSLRYAETIAHKKVQEQPDVPVSAGDLLESMPNPAFGP